ncbi:MAG: sigma-54-dependent Fis family transcriptional regulator [Ignavibacteria bacterium]|nr:sigma-54-dependent Fis family transcriptional regulator [Ignavibacteria bacterium]
MNFESTLIGDSPAVKRLKKEIPQLGKSQRPLLIKGDVGVGKGMIGRLIYEALSAKGSLVTLNPLTSTDVEIKNVLSDANPTASVYLFRDIEDFSFLYQVQIRRFIEPLPKKAHVQIIITTKRTIGESHREGRLVEELYELMKSFEMVTIPPLHQRPSDIPLLVEQFAKNACESIGVKLKVIDINTLDFLVRRDWKENVRELKSVIERAVLTSQGEMIELPEYLIDEYSQLDGILANIKIKKSFAFDKSLYNLEKTLIERTLETVGYNQSKAAEMLKLSEANLRYRLKKFHIPTSQESKEK